MITVTRDFVKSDKTFYMAIRTTDRDEWIVTDAPWITHKGIEAIAHMLLLERRRGGVLELMELASEATLRNPPNKPRVDGCMLCEIDAYGVFIAGVDERYGAHKKNLLACVRCLFILLIRTMSPRDGWN